jgi:hypothetical protein
LLELAGSLPDSDVYYDAGEIRVDQRWDQTPRTDMTIDQLIDRIENAGAWILLKRSNRFPQYRALLDQGLAEIENLVGPGFPKRTKMRSAVVLITPLNRITTHHIDPDCNFLCQIRGSKTLHVFDRYDREVLPEEEIERFWAVDNNAAVFKEPFSGRAHDYHLSRWRSCRRWPSLPKQYLEKSSAVRSSPDRNPATSPSHTSAPNQLLLHRQGR